MQPAGPLIEGSDGKFYGTTVGGGATGDGTVFRMNRDGSGYQVIHNSGPNDVDVPQGPLCEGSDGVLYGATYNGGARGVGCVFRLNKDGSGFRVLVSFGDGNGAYPLGGIIEGSDGKLYGTTSGGSGGGTIFQLNRDGSGFNTLYTFTGFTDGSSPYGELLEGSDGVLYGATGYGGTTNRGTIFKIGKNGTGYSVLHHFGVSLNDGGRPQGGLIEDQSGMLYGVADTGGSNSVGVVFKLAKDGAGYTILHHFHYAGGDGYRPQQMIEGRDGRLYGVTYNGGVEDLGAVFALNKDGGDYAVLRSFTWSATDAPRPVGVIEGSDGLLYGTGGSGGVSFDGVVFKMAKDGSAFSLVRSLLATGGDGRNPSVPMVEGVDGVWYGTCMTGGNNNAGVVFEVVPDTAEYRILHHFGSDAADGRQPRSALILDREGWLYGTTSTGGSSNAGIIFRFRTNGSNYTVMYHFGVATNDGLSPYAGLTEASDGKLYGTTHWGGTAGQGTVFRIHKDGSGYAVLHEFVPYAANSGIRDVNPFSPLVEGRDGSLYGVTATNGVIFKISKNGSGYAILQQMGSVHPNLVVSSDGWLYGSSSGGGTYGKGTVFRLKPDGTELLRYSINPSFKATIGERPGGGLVEGRDGYLYGFTTEDGTSNRGALFRVRKSDLSVTGLYSFSNQLGPDGPVLREGSDGCLYGLTYYGGTMGLGEIYRLVVPALTRLNITCSGQDIQLGWKAVPGLTYRVQWRTNLNDSTWSDLPGEVIPTSINAWKVDVKGGVGRFYRAVH